MVLSIDRSMTSSKGSKPRSLADRGEVRIAASRLLEPALLGVERGVNLTVGNGVSCADLTLVRLAGVAGDIWLAPMAVGEAIAGICSGVDGHAFRFGRAGVKSLVMLLAVDMGGEQATAAGSTVGVPGASWCSSLPPL